MDEELDVLLIGGGVAALWLLARLRERGRAARLLVEGAPGGAQSLAAQGIIHGGLRYALGAAPHRATPLQAMPERWVQCLEGRAAPDLRAARVHARELLLWHAGGAGARTAALATRLLAARVRTLPAAEHPAVLGGATRVWAIEEPVVDVPSVVEALLAAHAEAVAAVDWHAARFLRASDGRVEGIAQGAARLRARTTLLCAGEGNEGLLALLGASTPAMRRRPLQQVMLKHPALPPFFGHCIGARGRVRLTVTSHPHPDGSRVWYLGGELAERGAALPAAAQTAAARQEIAQLFPALALPGALWRTHRAVRAEPQLRSARPGDAYLGAVRGAPGALVAWPVKLALLPRLADRLEAELGIAAPPLPARNTLPAPATTITRARAPWEELFP
jgi:glycine/D-amino acid oxidase-like deaminating enzyme